MALVIAATQQPLLANSCQDDGPWPHECPLQWLQSGKDCRPQHSTVKNQWIKSIVRPPQLAHLPGTVANIRDDGVCVSLNSYDVSSTLSKNKSVATTEICEFLVTKNVQSWLRYNLTQKYSPLKSLVLIICFCHCRYHICSVISLLPVSSDVFGSCLYLGYESIQARTDQ